MWRLCFDKGLKAIKIITNALMNAPGKKQNGDFGVFFGAFESPMSLDWAYVTRLRGL